MSNKVIPVEKILSTFLEDIEALREDGASLTFTPEEIKKIAKVKPEGLELQVSNSKQEITFAAGAHNAEEEVTFTKTANGIHKTDANGEADYDDVAELVDAFSGVEQQQEADVGMKDKVNTVWSGKKKPGEMTPQEKAAFMRHRNASKMVPDKSKQLSEATPNVDERFLNKILSDKPTFVKRLWDAVKINEINLATFKEALKQYSQDQDTGTPEAEYAHKD